MGRLHPWVFHAPKVTLWAGAGFKRASFLSPNPARARNILLKRDLGRRPNLSSEWDMCIACLSTVILLNVMFIKKKNYQGRRHGATKQII